MINVKVLVSASDFWSILRQVIIGVVLIDLQTESREKPIRYNHYHTSFYIHCNNPDLSSVSWACEFELRIIRANTSRKIFWKHWINMIPNCS